MTQVQQRGVEDIQPGSPVGTRRVPVGAPIYNEVVTFLYEEATLLDQIRLQEWAERLDTDLVYTVPLRQTRLASELKTTIVRSVQHYHDDYRSMMGRILRLSGKSAWAEDPPSRTRRLVTNVFVEETQKPDEFVVTSYLLLTRSRFKDHHVDIISGERRDVLRLGANGFKLARREVILDQAVLGTPNLAIFL
ncbi:aromatic-ring-hydroxylating dioxygenase subunit beta [Pseudomonas asiatica]|jgi:3-phenylpropionate/cinnamic acid dioxygenase small subunit|uniref:aromatic-ring-hydroxylating dioxygenase subunit beta n=1 Tax=Pseudomonas TaxID=286 RepID=UPI000648D307|nr:MULTISPECIES: aromatic-ring-hydroxylating dioxygenase subunit beta [Pseudomonas]EKT4559130.1 aromatic-ring-hydroxylating dioxygenase subunit beta [Pseudomonas putida]ELU0813840.1 aromatic-ring-hydroxylating dioxygenase subunit beta [Pseudomonas putida]MDP9537148.1 aromatic-ring-hydroxylating dioxygenase subunit beta [Pseudomonas putida]MEB6590654.1 aromatic-ring-hydroxylating dioxygenase subunit beta [Pseudomonas asiatica]QDY39271.1 aromatic-ring-hydroxylating dioxygenase subunit beta [Pseu